MDGEKLKRWAVKEFDNYKAEIEREALDEFLSFVGNNLWLMFNEAKKLINYAGGKKIKLEDVRLLVRPKIEIDIFRTIDSLARKNRSEALNLIHKHLEKGDAPLYLLSMINFQFRNLLEIKYLAEKNIPYYAILKKSSLHPFVIKKAIGRPKNLRFSN